VDKYHGGTTTRNTAFEKVGESELPESRGRSGSRDRWQNQPDPPQKNHTPPKAQNPPTPKPKTDGTNPLKISQWKHESGELGPFVIETWGKK